MYNYSLAHPVDSAGLGLSLGGSCCIPCSKHWLLHLIGIVIAAFVAGIALVIFTLALNMIVVVGTPNGILFYAKTVAAKADTYFLPFSTPVSITVFIYIAWLNFDIGFDVCFDTKEPEADIYNGATVTLY